MGVIRAAKIEDAPQIANVHVASWRTTYVGHVPQAYLDELSVPQREAACSAALSSPTQRMLVVEEDGEITGFSSFGPSRDADAALHVSELYAIYLKEESRGRGLGVALWRETYPVMQRLSYAEVTLWVLDSNLRAR